MFFDIKTFFFSSFAPETKKEGGEGGQEIMRENN